MKVHVTPENMTPAQLGQVLLNLHKHIELLEDVLSHTIMLLLEARGTIERPDDDHVAYSSELIQQAVVQWHTEHQRSREIEQELRDERN